MKVVILGSGTAVQTEGTGYAGIYIEVNGRSLLFDAGPGTLVRLNRLGKSLIDIERVYLTHLHPDHSLDALAFLFGLRIPLPRRRHRVVHLCGPAGLQRWLRAVDQAYHGWLSPRHYRLRVVELREGVYRNADFQLQVRQMQHSAPAFGYRLIHQGKHVVYSGDTDDCPAIRDLAQGADVLILECSMPDEQKVEGHLTPSECGVIAAAARPKHLVLTHFYPVFKGYPIRRRVRRYFDGPLTLARGLTPIAV